MITIKLTAQGTMKINTLVTTATQAMKHSLKKNVDTVVLDSVSKHAPDPREEARILSEGTTDTGDFYSKLDLSRSFIKGSSFKYLKNAILDNKSKLGELGQIIRATVYNTKTFNDSIGFSWLKKKGNAYVKRHTTDSQAGAAWENLVNMWENGGTFTVYPRDKGDTLIAGFKSMTKTISGTSGPWKMYGRGAIASVAKLRVLIQKDVKSSIKHLN